MTKEEAHIKAMKIVDSLCVISEYINNLKSNDQYKIVDTIMYIILDNEDNKNDKLS